MPKYEVLRKSYIQGNIVEEGAVIFYDGPPGGNLRPLDEAAKRKAADYNRKTGERMPSGDPGFILKMAQIMSGTLPPEN